MHSKTNLKTEPLKAQIVVIGGGGAGLCAAVAAVEKGADVILLEKASKPGGNSAMAFGPFAAESPAQKRELIDAQIDELFKIHMNFSHWNVNARLFRAFLDKSGDTIRWLEEKGLTFTVLPHRPNQAPMTMHCAKGYGREIIEVLTKDFEKLGGRLLCNTAAKEISTSGNQGVTGILSKIKEGKEFRIKTGSVIIATGGYAGNKELLKKYWPYYKDNMYVTGFPNMGDGLLMALKIGAATEGLGIVHITGGGDMKLGVKVLVIGWEPQTVWVNKRGERFMDESFAYEHSRQEAAWGIIRQPESIYYTIFDEGEVQRIMKDGLFLGGHYNAEVWSGATLPDLPQLLESATESGKIGKSKSWNDIAKWIGADPKVLRSTINEYNSFCDKGHDPIFAKHHRFLAALRTPPYYAIRCPIRIINTIGGIKINHHMEVIDNEDRPIPGVYAVGIDAGGWEPEVYDARLSGSALGFPLNSGRIAGENAAKRVLGK